MLVVRDQHVLTAAEAGTIKEDDHVYFLAPPEKAQALDRFCQARPLLVRQLTSFVQYLSTDPDLADIVKKRGDFQILKSTFFQPELPANPHTPLGQAGAVHAGVQVLERGQERDADPADGIHSHRRKIGAEL